MDESEDTTTGGNEYRRKQGLVYRKSGLCGGYSNQGFGTFWLTKDGFPGQNEVIVVARKKGDQFSTAGGGKTAGIPLQNSEIV